MKLPKIQSLNNKLAILSGAGFLVTVIWLRIGGYYEGISFEKSWDAAMIGVPLSFVFAIVFLGTFLANLASVFTKKRPFPSILPFVVVPLMVLGFYQLPLPTYTDGLHKGVESKFSRQMLVNFANALHELEVDQIDPWRDKELLKKLRSEYPAELGMSTFSPRISISDSAVGLTYGGALTKHWGYFITEDDICPRPYLPEGRCQKVFDNVWVFHDIW